MRSYRPHLVFHLLAVVAGAACGVTAALWWKGTAGVVSLLVAALVVCLIVLAGHALYTKRTEAAADEDYREPRSQHYTPTRTQDLQANRYGTATRQTPPTAVQPQSDEQSHPGTQQYPGTGTHQYPGTQQQPNPPSQPGTKQYPGTQQYPGSR